MMFDWATQDHYKLWFTGKLERHRRTEQLLPRLVRYGRLVSQQYGKKFVYATKSKKNIPILHGLGVTETIVRICRSDNDGDFIPERLFKGFGSVPDWGIRYNEKLLLVEFSTQNNFEGARIIKTKMTNYRQNLTKIIEHFDASEVVVLFVLDVSSERVDNFVKRNPFDDPYFLVDYESFTKVPFGQQFSSSIYMWGDGKRYPLKK